ncbi:206_t:CDS:2 [Funneliformis caledonium]|uniref:206_t:CDS:1 n=1 Tax=Funneliformis caledonium TaxID=1117310 RepID=A0A9N9AZD1_9GLOM|nr:206_t:CDS:2 [Funneliformis caledonium]
MTIDNVDNYKPKSMALKQRNFEQAIGVIDVNFCYALYRMKNNILQQRQTSDSSYVVGKTCYGIELFDCFNKEWLKSKKDCKKPNMIYMLLDFSNGFALNEYEIQEDIQISFLDCGWHSTIWFTKNM